MRFGELQNTSIDISVVVPFYNDSQTIDRALRSISEQSLTPSNVIIIDDASRFEEIESLKLILSQYENLSIELISLPENGGPSVARNFGCSLAESTYIAFLDADDSWHKDKLLMQSEVLRENPNIGVLGTQNSYGASVKHEISRPPILSKVSIRAQLLRNRFATSSVIVRNYPEFRFNPELRYSEDNDLWCRILLSGAEGAVVLNPLTYFYKHLSSGKGASGNYLKMLNGQLAVYAGLRNDNLITKSSHLICVSSALLRFSLRMLKISVNRIGIGVAR